MIGLIDALYPFVPASTNGIPRLKHILFTWLRASTLSNPLMTISN